MYFDDRANSAYYEKLDGGPARDKYRIRIYGLNEKQIYLERKRKLGELIAKDSVHITRRLAEQILSGNPNRLELSKAPLLHDLFLEMRTNLLRPVVRVDYYREAFTFPVSHTRVTFDKRLSTGPFPAGLFDLSPGIMALDDEAGDPGSEVRPDFAGCGAPAARGRARRAQRDLQIRFVPSI